MLLDINLSYSNRNKKDSHRGRKLEANCYYGSEDWYIEIKKIPIGDGNVMASTTFGLLAISIEIKKIPIGDGNNFFAYFHKIWIIIETKRNPIGDGNLS